MRSLEPLLAEVVEQLMSRDFGRQLGSRTNRDATDQTGLRVDYIYEDAAPPLALEVSTVQDDEFLAGASESRKLEDRLTLVSVAESLGGYSVVLKSGTPMKQVEALILDVMRRGEDVSTNYSSNDLFRWKNDGTLSRQKEVRERFKLFGIAEIICNPQSNEVAVSTFGGEHLGDWRGFDDADVQINANMAKLIEAQGYEGHLAIGNNRYRVSNDPSRSRVPDLAAGLMRLWVVHLWGPGMVVWSLGAGERDWRLHSEIVVDGI